MRCNAINMLRQAKNCLEGGQSDDFGYSVSLEMLAEHLADVRDGKHTWEEFAEFYCLTERDRKQVAA
ncbi:hypothetical protein KFK14_11545 [Sphingobium phenoxybenzoativorans]|uniref:Uncharacterized protein n=1 Tax=Sphingobium phenoxybenzoativorans TaxID=1592790 RepID=A0A975Q3P8_9SPHN|nr:hypothetical protein [Sphingobium phenoxybenzoativorans]QUT07961.1 hypothetical protein KFK14_11545 [Sphingobium phenoxybenzoativorans]